MKTEENKKPHNPNAFPVDGVYAGESLSKGNSGMTLRDYFAAKAMQSIVQNYYNSTESQKYICQAWLGRKGTVKEHISVDSYAIADAMLKQREL